MWKCIMPSLMVCGVVALLVVTQLPANPPAQQKVVKAPAVAKNAAAPAQQVKAAVSRITAVTVYPNSALVTREVDVPAGKGALELTVTPLPPTTVNSSLYTEGADGVRVLTTRFRTRSILEDTREDVRRLQDELEKLRLEKEKMDFEIAAMKDNLKTVTKLEGFMSVTTIQAAQKGALNSDAAITLSKHIRETRLESAREMIALQQKLQANEKQASFVQRKLKEMASGPARVERDAVIVVENAQGAAGKVRLNYLVDSVSWRPQYKFRAGDTAKEPVQVEYLAAVLQHTGEDWSNVKLVLSTAQPMLNASPPALQTLQVTAVPDTVTEGAMNLDTMELQEQVRSLRNKAQMDFNSKKQSRAVGLVNTAAALGQSWELFNPDQALKPGCALAVHEGPTVTYHLKTSLTVPSRMDEQILEVTRLDLQPEYYYKSVPILTNHVYRQADLVNKSKYVLLPGEATMYDGADFVGRMDLPLVAIGEEMTVGFGIDPQLQVQRQMVDRARSTRGANQSLRYGYRILISSYKEKPVQLQVWDRLPHAKNEAVSVSLLKSQPEISKEPLYNREERPSNLLRWDVKIEPNMTGEKALAINYEFELELDRKMTISSFKTAGVFASTTSPINQTAIMRSMSKTELARFQKEMAKLSAEDRRLAQAQVYCAVDTQSPLGSEGRIRKVMIKGRPVFLCCPGCVAEARAHPDETLASLDKMIARMGSK